MQKKIAGTENIRDIFSIFHDGDIVQWKIEGENLTLEVSIEYLASRINPDYSKFTVTLYGVDKIHFTTWPSDLESSPVLISDTAKIFDSNLEILEGNIKRTLIEVICNHHSPKYEYCGGELYLIAESATVIDEGSQSYSIEDLDKLCSEYWEEWKNRNNV